MSHEFEVQSYSQPTKCAYCQSYFIGITKQGFRCQRCKVDVHKKCIANAKQKFACLNPTQASAAVPMVRRTSSGVGSEPYPADDADEAAISHSFATSTFTSPAFCCVCKALITGVYKQGVSCSLCGAASHFKCQDAALSSVACMPGRKRESGISQISSAVKSFGRNNSDSANGPQISGPTNFQHVAGATQGRTLVPLGQAQQDDRFKQEPVPIGGNLHGGAAAGAAAGAEREPAGAASRPPARAAPRRPASPASPRTRPAAPASARPASPPQRAPPGRPARPAPPPRTSSPSASTCAPPAAPPVNARRPPAPGRPLSAASSTSSSSASASSASGAAADALAGDVNRMSIGKPTDVVHEVHTNYNAAVGEYEGLPAEWRSDKGLSALSFGSSITSQPRIHLDGYDDRIPTILVLMGRELRRRDGFKEEGLFRIAPSRTEQARVRGLLCESSSEGVTDRALRECRDTHVIAALMKEWCRMLEKSILSELSRPDLEALTKESFEESPPSPAARDSYEALLFSDKFISTSSSNTLLWLLDLMAVVVQYRDANKMGNRAITTCFAPSIYVLDEPLSSPMDSIVVIKLITTLLVNALHFVQDHPSSPGRDTFGDRAKLLSTSAAHAGDDVL